MTSGGAGLDLIERELFCALMRRLASSVTVIASAHDGRIHGMTATAVCSVCADPPTILIVVNRSARSHAMIAGSGAFVVNILAEGQRDIAERFAGKLNNQFAGIGYHAKGAGAPVLCNTAAHFECRVVGELEAGTHTIFVGRVLSGNVAGELPLLYHGGRYANVAGP